MLYKIIIRMLMYCAALGLGIGLVAAGYEVE